VTNHIEPSIVLCEPQCWGFEHAAFNAALLQTVLSAYPEDRVVFLGEKGHVGHVREVLGQWSTTDQPRVVWQEIGIPSRLLTGWRRMNAESTSCRNVLALSSVWNARAVIMCSMTETGLLALKARLCGSSERVPILVVLHSVLRTLEQRLPRRPWNWIVHLRQVLKLPHSRQLSYVALGGSIQAALNESAPRAARHFQVLDPPYFMAERSASTNGPPILRFGYFGTAIDDVKGFRQFVEVAEEASHAGGGVANEFVMVGFLNRRGDPVSMNDQVVKGLSYTALPYVEYTQRAREVTYAVSIADPRHYRLVASASFLDALCYVKPGIYLRNPFIEYYFDRMGDIGYLCSSYGEVRDNVLSIVARFPVDRYERQCQNILIGRRLFQPQMLAPRLRAIVTQTRSTAVGKG